MTAQYIGETAAILTSLLWTLCSLFFASAGRRMGALSVNAYRIIIALGLLSGVHLLVFGTLSPGANNDQWIYLSISGIIGLGIGDFGYFGALIHLGPRKAVLLMSMSPIFSVISAYFILDEVPGMFALVGISITLIGVAIVVVERAEFSGEPELTHSNRIKGIIAGIGGSIGQGVGLVISKYGMINAASDPSNPLNPLSVTLIRLLSAGIFVWLVVIISGNSGHILRSLKDRTGLSLTFVGAALGPFIGVYLSMVALNYTYAGVAATLMSLMPVMVIPIIYLKYRQKTNLRGVAGALVAFTGVAIIFLF